MERKELYHLHKINTTSKIWHEHAVITIRENFKNPIFNRCQRFTTAVDTGEDVKNLYDLLMQTSPNNLTAEKLRFLLAECYRVSFNANEFKREQALETFRILNASTKPSRLHSIYLTDEKGIEFWMKSLGTKDLELYRVEAEGSIFKTSDHLIPDERFSYEKVISEAYKYWNPNFSKIEEDANEYLVQGKVKVLEKII